MATIAVSGNAQSAPLLASAPFQSGRYYFAPNATLAATSATLGNGSLRVMPFYLPNAVTLSRIGAEVTAAGDAGSTIRLGIYADDGTGRPGNRVIDAGTIAADSATVQEIVIALALAAGIYWIGGAVQGVTVTQPTVRTSSTMVLGVDAGTVIPAAGNTDAAMIVGGVTAALPASFGAAAPAGSSPRCFVKVA